MTEKRVFHAGIKLQLLQTLRVHTQRAPPLLKAPSVRLLHGRHPDAREKHF